ncbi:MAG: PAS domain S-box protein [Verrucomicrobia bacterium]|nr:PAS domain S-box protein [Verrucomicrobiota bacterium]
MESPKPGFLDKLIGRISRVPPEEAQAHLVRLVREKGFFETIFNSIHEGIIVCDPRGRITYLNDAACALFGLDRAKSLGRRLSERVRGLAWDELAQSDRLISRDMQIFYPQQRFLNFYVVPLRPDEFDPAATAKPVDEAARDAQGRPLSYAMIVRDITETRRNAEETIESERFNALTLLAAGVAHELGNPLNSLHIHLQLMERKIRKLEGPHRSALEEEVRVARDEIRRLDFIVTQFLRAVRPSIPQMQREDVNSVVREAVSFLASELEDRGVLVELELAEGLPPILFDRDQMKQAFYNVVKNAGQAMKTGGVLRVRTEAASGMVLISFEDNGGGISADNLSKVFDPYFTTKSSGTGLGLMIVRRIVREHGGEVGLQSDEGRGLTVTIRLPTSDRRVQMLEAPRTPAED